LLAKPESLLVHTLYSHGWAKVLCYFALILYVQENYKPMVHYITTTMQFNTWPTLAGVKWTKYAFNPGELSQSLSPL